MSGIKRKLLIAVALVFCVLYLYFIRLESNYKFDTMNNNKIDQIEPYEDIRHQKQETELQKAESGSNNYPVTSDSADAMAPTSLHTTTRTAVILFCEGRSGSTWLSSFFWKNPNVFYVYEPLYPGQPSNKNVAAGEHAHMMRDHAKISQVTDVYNCHIDYGRNTIFPLPLGRYPYYQPELKACERARSCAKTIGTLTQYCTSKSHVVQKIIRVFNISDFIELKKSLGFQIKIIHLVRDPRPHILSRQKIFSYMYNEDDPVHYNQKSPEDQSKDRTLLCQRVLSNLKLADTGMFGEDYFRITHEEMSLKPLKWAKELYKFVGLEYNEATEKYINEITHPTYEGGMDPDGRYRQFSVYRDSMAVLNKWRQSAKPSRVQEIERECGDLLKYLKYEKLYDEQGQLVNEEPWPLLSQED